MTTGMLSDLPVVLASVAQAASALLLLLGLLFWFAGSWPLLGRSSYLTKLHYLGISDTLGSALMLLGLLLRFQREWPLLVLALLSLVVWNTIFGYVLAACSQPRRRS
ncbi:MAG: monovalent cation/H(+) antiporter subunit G [Prochlorococcaceae cyanobacterium]